MEDKNKSYFTFSDFDELRDIRRMYIDSLNDTDVINEKSKYPSLVYAIYNRKLSKTFFDRIYVIKNDIKEIIERLNNYKGIKIDPKEEKLKLDEIMTKLNSIEKKEIDDYKYYADYLVGVEENFYSLKTKEAEHIYVNTSKQILNIRLNNYLKNEKSFLLFNDNINKLNKIFNI